MRHRDEAKELCISLRTYGACALSYALLGEKCLLEKVDEKTNQGQAGML